MANYRQEVMDDSQFAGNEHLMSFYAECRKNGCSVNIAKMLSLQEPPRDFRTDRTFMANLNPLASDPGRLIRYRKQAEKQGVDVNGAVYLRGLAKRNGDPKAWVRGIDDIRRLAKERRIRVETGNEDILVDSLGESPPEMPDIGVDPKIVEKEVRKHERKTGEKLRGKARTDMKEKIFNARKPEFSKATFQAK